MQVLVFVAKLSDVIRRLIHDGQPVLSARLVELRHQRLAEVYAEHFRHAIRTDYQKGSLAEIMPDHDPEVVLDSDYP